MSRVWWDEGDEGDEEERVEELKSWRSTVHVRQHVDILTHSLHNTPYYKRLNWHNHKHVNILMAYMAYHNSLRQKKKKTKTKQIHY